MSMLHSISILLFFSQLIACAEGSDADRRLQVPEIPPAMNDDPYTRNMVGEMTDNPMGGESDAGEMNGRNMAGEMALLDHDQDYIVDSEDNCPHVYNPEQSDINNDGQGDACEPDADRDGIPDQWDPAPMDTAWPGRALPDTVYAHTGSELYALDVKHLNLSYVSTFNLTGQASIYLLILP